MRRLLAASLLVLSACSRHAAPATQDEAGAAAGVRFAGVPLIPTENAQQGPMPDGPVVSVLGGEIRVDGTVVGLVQPILDAGRMMRVDGVFQSLKNRREIWKASHAGGEPFAAVALLAIDAGTPSLVVKSVFQTTAFAGFPNICMVVSRAGAAACLPVDAQVPGPPGTSRGLREGATTVNGRLPPEVIQHVVRTHFGGFRRCYEDALTHNAHLRGQVSVRFVIAKDGKVSDVRDAGSTLPDPAVIACVVKGFGDLSFPAPDGGIVTVVYPISFSPGD